MTPGSRGAGAVAHNEVCCDAPPSKLARGAQREDVLQDVQAPSARASSVNRIAFAILNSL